MKTLQQVDRARSIVADKLQEPGLSNTQLALLTGMLNALVWVADGPASATMDRLLGGEPLAAGKDPTPALQRLKTGLANAADN